jgi:hypothetical protein
VVKPQVLVALGIKRTFLTNCERVRRRYSSSDSTLSIFGASRPGDYGSLMQAFWAA